MPTERELHAFIATVDEVGLPIMLYNNPGRTGVNLDARRMTELAKLRHVVALKDSAKDLGQLAATLRAVRSELAVFVGFESYVVACVQRGAVGVVGMAPNVLGGDAVQLFRLATEGGAGLEPVQERIDLLYEAMYGWNYNPYVVAKEAMRLLGRPGGHPRPPLLPMLEPDREKLRALLLELGAIPRAAAQ
ncbi:MAG: dihydrodipicolinate synthase family protein [Acetobacteraceae bacterium]|nr:dihydrodipicolinate synthase family protein [Acetobacteraceae bacterium]